MTPIDFQVKGQGDSAKERIHTMAATTTDSPYRGKCMFYKQPLFLRFFDAAFCVIILTHVLLSLLYLNLICVVESYKQMLRPLEQNCCFIV